MKNILRVVACLFLCASLNSFGSTISSVSMIIDKPSYNSSYAFGMDVFIDADELGGVDDVFVEHFSSQGVLEGTWELDRQSSTHWWSWSETYRKSYVSGPVDGYFSVSLLDLEDNEMDSISYIFPIGEELEAMPQPEISKGETGYGVTGATLANVDYYNLLVWDPVERYYPFSKQVSSNEITIVPYDQLEDDREYRFFFMAVNSFDLSDEYISDSSFRSYAVEYIIHDSSQVPVPAAAWLFGTALASLRFIRHKKVS